MVNLHCCLHLMSAHGSATADASVMAPSPFAVKLSVGAVGAVEAVGGGGALSQEGGAAACSPTGSATADASVMAPSPFAVKLAVGAVGAVEAVGGGGALSQEGGAANCSPTVSQESAESSSASTLASPGASWGNPEGGLELILPHASHALARGAVPATA